MADTPSNTADSKAAFIEAELKAMQKASECHGLLLYAKRLNDRGRSVEAVDVLTYVDTFYPRKAGAK